MFGGGGRDRCNEAFVQEESRDICERSRAKDRCVVQVCRCRCVKRGQMTGVWV